MTKKINYTVEDLKSISEFNTIVKNYLKMAEALKQVIYDKRIWIQHRIHKGGSKHRYTILRKPNHQR